MQALSLGYSTAWTTEGGGPIYPTSSTLRRLQPEMVSPGHQLSSTAHASGSRTKTCCAPAAPPHGVTHKLAPVGGGSATLSAPPQCLAPTGPALPPPLATRLRMWITPPSPQHTSPWFQPRVERRSRNWPTKPSKGGQGDSYCETRILPCSTLRKKGRTSGYIFHPRSECSRRSSACAAEHRSSLMQPVVRFRFWSRQPTVL